MQSVQSVVNSRSEGNERRTTDYTDYTDYTDKEGIGVQGVYTRRVAAKEVLDHDFHLTTHSYCQAASKALLHLMQAS